MRAKIVKIGNSRGIRLPKSVIDEANLGDEVELKVKKGKVVISRVKKVREGWAEDALHMAKHEKPIFHEFPPTHFMLHEHEWPMEDFEGLDD
jgi:antitoxin MazE